MKPTIRICALILFIAIASGCLPQAAPTVAPTIPMPPVFGTPTPEDLVSTEHLFAFLTDLTAVQPYSGWRSSGTEGEREGLDRVQAHLMSLPYLLETGTILSRQELRVFLATELWQTGVELTVGGQTVLLPANGMRGSRDSIEQALNMDSDGRLNDRERNPVRAAGAVVPIFSESDLSILNETAGKVLLVDFTLVDSVTQAPAAAQQNARDLLAAQPAGILLVTQFSNRPGLSHGTFSGEGGVFTSLENSAKIPILTVRLEDMRPAGIEDWDDLAGIEQAALVWDADVLSPAPSSNLMARIPGHDSSKAVILGAHIDSPNSPGAMDDGSGSAVLMEVARVINQARIQPPQDVVLVWFGSEELGLYGSSAFANANQELIDRATAMLQIDCLTRPLDGVPAELMVNYWPAAPGGGTSPWALALQNAAAKRGISLRPMYLPLSSDNASFTGYNLPNANLILDNEQMMEDVGGTWYAGHIHDPYDTVETARDSAAILKQMAEIAVHAALLPTGAPPFRSTPAAGKRVVVLAGHTEAVHMTPTSLAALGMAFADAGMDVDTVPYGTKLTTEALQDAALVIALPVFDYPTDEAGASYDESWQPEEVQILREYVAGGGRLLLTNSAVRLKYYNRTYERNEDLLDANALAAAFGVTFLDTALTANSARINADGLPGLSGSLTLTSGAGVPFEISDGTVLASAGNLNVLALTAGERVLVLADLSLLGATPGGTVNPALLIALPRWAQGK